MSGCIERPVAIWRYRLQNEVNWGVVSVKFGEFGQILIGMKAMVGQFTVSSAIQPKIAGETVTKPRK